MSVLLKLNNISVWRGEVLLINDLSFSLDAGGVVQVLGPNGCGKTTLLRIACGIGLSDDGNVLWRDQDTLRFREQFHQELLYIGHKPGINAALTPLENLLIHTKLNDSMGQADVETDTSQAIIAVLDELGIAEKATITCNKLSAGQQRRVALARLKLQKATLWVLDEPLTSLDKAGHQWVSNAMDTHLASGGAMVFTTHTPLALSTATVQLLDLGLL